MTESDRQKILAIADPRKFSRTRYQSPPHNGATPEVETDCSHFVHDIMNRAGFEFPYTPTRSFECLRSFKSIPSTQALPGDLIMFSGHVGILGSDGLIISATTGGKNRRSSLDPDDKDFLSSITRLTQDQFGRETPKVIRWSCP